MTRKAGTLRITVNGEPRDVAAGTTIAQILREAGLPEDQVAIELNRRLVRSPDYGREIADGDSVEIVTFVGGG